MKLASRLAKVKPSSTLAVTAKVLETGEGRLRLSIRALRDDEERAAYEGYQHGVRGAQARMGTLGDLMKMKLKK